MIHPTAIVDAQVDLGADVEIGPGCVIGSDVSIGEGTWIGAHVVIKGSTRIGRHNKIFHFNSIGEDSQSLDYHGEKTYLEIGDHNIIREFCTLNRGTVGGGGTTRVGDHNLLMAYVHVAHDCQIHSHTILANATTLAGHVVIEDYARLSGLSAIHQFCRVGAYSFLGRSGKLYRDALPYLMLHGNPASPCGLNTVGLKRHGFSDETILHLRRAYKILFREGLTLDEAVVKLTAQVAACPPIQRWLDVIADSKRHIAR